MREPTGYSDDDRKRMNKLVDGSSAEISEPKANPSSKTHVASAQTRLAVTPPRQDVIHAEDTLRTEGNTVYAQTIYSDAHGHKIADLVDKAGHHRYEANFNITTKDAARAVEAIKAHKPMGGIEEPNNRDYDFSARAGKPVTQNPIDAAVERSIRAREAARSVRNSSEWCDLPQSMRDSTVNEDMGTNKRDPSCDLPNKGKKGRTPGG